MDYQEDFYEFDDDEQQPCPRANRAMVGVIVALSIVIALLLGGIAFVYFGGMEKVTEFLPFLQQPTTAEPTTEAPTTLPPTTAEPEPEMVEVPYVVGMLEKDAYSKFNVEGVRYTVSRQFSDEVPMNYVISQSPQEGEIKKTDKVTLYISKGKEGEIVPFTTTPKKSESSKADDDDDEKKATSPVISGDYMLDGSDSRYISASELSGMSRQELNYALNEIYARHGRRFNSAQLQSWFDSKSWYNGTISPSAFNDNILNKYEKANIVTIVSYMESKGYR